MAVVAVDLKLVLATIALWGMCAVAPNAWAQSSLRSHVRFLASDECSGREIGTEGHDRARDYIAEQMEAIGLLPAGTDRYFVPVQIVRSAKSVDSSSLRFGTTVLAAGAEYRVLDFSDGTLGGQPLFLGYGLEAPQYGWDEYGEHDVRGRTVVVFTGAPPQVMEQLADSDRYLLSDASKAAVALSHGATGIIIINDPRGHGDGTGQREDRLRAVRPDFALRGIGGARVTKRAAMRAFASMGLDLEQYQQSLDYRPLSVEVMFDAVGDLSVEREVVTAHNVIGKLDGGEGPPIVLGAHFDHLGMGGPASLYRGKKAWHPGADDNASGVAVLLDAAARLREITSTRPIYFIAFTGEEYGLRGSRTMARVLLDRTFNDDAVFLNLDMIGRLDLNDLIVYADPQDAALRRVTDGATRAGLTLDWRPLEATHSDHIPFAELGWQAIDFSTGRHSDYHRPSDTVSKIDWDGLQKISGFITATIRLLATK